MKHNLAILFLVCTILNGYSQSDNMEFGMETITGYTSANTVPFWLRSNQYGSVPGDGLSLSLIATAGKTYDRTKKHFFDWGASFEGRMNTGRKTDFFLTEGYGKFRLGIVEFRGGRIRETMGLCDTSLTSGAFAVSGNAPGIPKIEISIPEYYTLPFLGRMFAFKGNYAHGWIGETPVRMMDNTIIPLKTYLHQKSFYGRFGKHDWKWKLYGGFSHQVFWGSEKIYYGSDYTLTNLQAYLYIVSGKPYGTSDIPSSKIGNQLGSIDLGMEYHFRNLRLMIYRQNIYDIGALYYLANIRDGLNGISIINDGKKRKGFNWEKILVEFFYTKNQAGELWSPFTPSGDENYYNNDQYINGWSYKEVGLGNPFICPGTYTREGLPADPRDYFINNRVALIHLGFEGSMNKWSFISKTSYSLNYGTFGTSTVGHTFGKTRTLPLYGIFEETRQFSAYLELDRIINDNYIFGVIGALDAGKLYYNSSGILIKLSRNF